MNNKKLGTSFEKRVCDIFSEHGYWVHFLSPDNRGTQPFDIIAVKNGLAWAVECKTLSLSQKYFSISRLEDNQILAFEKWIQCGNKIAIIVVEYGDKIYWISYESLREQKKIKMEDLM